MARVHAHPRSMGPKMDFLLSAILSSLLRNRFVSPLNSLGCYLYLFFLILYISSPSYNFHFQLSPSLLNSNPPDLPSHPILIRPSPIPSPLLLHCRLNQLPDLPYYLLPPHHLQRRLPTVPSLCYIRAPLKQKPYRLGPPRLDRPQQRRAKARPPNSLNAIQLIYISTELEHACHHDEASALDSRMQCRGIGGQGTRRDKHAERLHAAH